MMTNGIRIFDKTILGTNHVDIKLSNILAEISNRTQFYWSILFLDGMGVLGDGKSIVALANEIHNSKRGIFINWNEINPLLDKTEQLFSIILIGSKDESSLHRYENFQNMYETCDFVIELINCSFWEATGRLGKSPATARNST